MMVFKIDGVAYDSVRVTKLKRSFSVLDTTNTGRTLADGRMHRDIIGTYYNYEIEISVNKDDQSRALYDSLYEILSSPTVSHVLTVPYGQGYKTFDAYITDGEDELEKMTTSGNDWSGLTLKFIAMEAARTP